MRSDHPAARAAHQADAHRGLRIAALTAVALGVLVLAAAAFVLSYGGIHATALKAGVSAPLARIYPLIFDAMLLVAGAAVLSLRGSGLVARCYAWLTMIVLLAAAAGADALHATGTRIPSRPAAATVAIIPWALVLISFGLLIAMLRHAQHRRGSGSAREAGDSPAVQASSSVVTAPRDPAWPHTPPAATTAARPAAGHSARPSGGPPLSGLPGPAGLAVPAGAAEPAGAAVPDEPALPEPDDSGDAGPGSYGQPYWQDTGAEPDADADAGQDDPTSDEASAPDQSAAHWIPRARQAEHIGDDVYSPGSLSAAPTPDPGDDTRPDPATPPFDRVWSSPTPPAADGPAADATAADDAES